MVDPQARHARKSRSQRRDGYKAHICVEPDTGLITGGFTRDDFTIDTDARTVTCPAGHTKAITSKAARFGALCNGCPLRCGGGHLSRAVTL